MAEVYRPTSVPLRFWHLMRNIPDFLDHSECLYVGGNKSRLQLVAELFWASYKITIVEIWKPYLSELRMVNEKRPYFHQILQGDVHDLSAVVGSNKYRMVVWWHGPEHVDRPDLPQCLKSMEEVATELCVIGCPHGHCGQGVTRDGNIYQRHRTHWLPSDFKQLGWESATLREEPGMNSHLIGWKRQC